MESIENTAIGVQAKPEWRQEAFLDFASTSIVTNPGNYPARMAEIILRLKSAAWGDLHRSEGLTRTDGKP